MEGTVARREEAYFDPMALAILFQQSDQLLRKPVAVDIYDGCRRVYHGMRSRSLHCEKSLSVMGRIGDPPPRVNDKYPSSAVP
jgi:hypothetical protein